MILHYRSLTAILVCLLLSDGAVSQGGERDGLPLARDGEHLGQVSKRWAYPRENDLKITRSLGMHFPLHLVSTVSDDPFAKICQYYAAMCGHKTPLGEELAFSGTADHAVYLIRYFPVGSNRGVPRRVFIHQSVRHTVTVTVMRPRGSTNTQVDVSVAVR